MRSDQGKYQILFTCQNQNICSVWINMWNNILKEWFNFLQCNHAKEKEVSFWQVIYFPMFPRVFWFNYHYVGVDTACQVKNPLTRIKIYQIYQKKKKIDNVKEKININFTFHTNTLHQVQQVCWRSQSEIQQIAGMQSEHISFQFHIILRNQQGTNTLWVLLDWLIASTAAATDSGRANCWTMLLISGALRRKIQSVYGSQCSLWPQEMFTPILVSKAIPEQWKICLNKQACR